MLVRNVYSLGRKLCVQKKDYDYWHRGGSDDIVVASLARLERKRKIIMFNISSWRLAHKSFLFSFLSILFLCCTFIAIINNIGVQYLNICIHIIFLDYFESSLVSVYSLHYHLSDTFKRCSYIVKSRILVLYACLVFYVCNNIIIWDVHSCKEFGFISVSF